MIRRTIAYFAIACALFCMSLSFADAQVSAGKTSANRSDAMLFRQAQEALRKSEPAKARLCLNTLIDTYPDSDYVPRAKLSVGDSWYSEHAVNKAELEYQDVITFFPNRPEAAEAQRRISAIRKDASF
jgi:outer membrane protein assembly factor BamD